MSGFVDDRPQQATLSVGESAERTAGRESKTLEGSAAFADDREHGRGRSDGAEQAALTVESGRAEEQAALGDPDPDGAFAFDGYEADPTQPGVWLCPHCDRARDREKWDEHGNSRRGFAICPECESVTDRADLSGGRR